MSDLTAPTAATASPGMQADVRAAQRRAINDSGWHLTFHLRQAHNPAFWLYAALIALGTYQFVQLLVADARVFGPSIVTGLFIWTLFTLPWIWFINHKDRFHRSSGRVALVGFAWGALVATWVMALPGNAAVQSIAGKIAGADFVQAWGASVAAPLVEESSKGAGIVMLVLLARPYVRTAYDGLVYGAFVGLGFQVAEDFFYGMNASATTFGIDQVQAQIANVMARGTYAGMVSHALYSALVGAGIGWWVQHRDQSVGYRLSRTVPLIGAAYLLHFFWDSAAALGFIVIPLTFVNALILITIVVRWTGRQERPWVADLLAPEVADGVVTNDEITALAGSPRDRRHFARRAKHESGRHAGKAARHLLDAELDLIDAIARDHGAETQQVLHARAEVVRMRDTLTAATA